MLGLNEAIEVGVLFGSRGVRPVWFRWQGRRVEIKTVTLHWRHWEGWEMISHFTVSDDLNLYELILRHQALTWRLCRVEAADA